MKKIGYFPVSLALITAITTCSTLPALATTNDANRDLLAIVEKKQIAIEETKKDIEAKKANLNTLETTLLDAKASEKTAEYIAIPFAVAGTIAAVWGGIRLASVVSNASMHSWNGWDTYFSRFFGGITLAGLTAAGVPLYVVHLKASKMNEVLDLIAQTKESLAASEAMLAADQAELELIKNHIENSNK